MSFTAQTEVPVLAPQAGLHALLRHAAFAPIANMGWLRITGSDRVRWLNGMVTNSIQSLQPGEGCYNFVLNAQGRIQADGTAFLLADSILFATADADRLATLFDHFIIMDDVELADLSSTRHGLTVIGPTAATLLETLGAPLIAPLSFAMSGLYEVHHAFSPIVPRFEVWSEDPSAIPRLRQQLEASNIPIAPAASLEALRILEGTPRYGTDIRDKELPQETGQTRALHFAKGCYLGQEIVERIRSRGNVHRQFSGFLFTGELPAPGTALESDAKPVGEITSAASIPLASGTIQLGLGYIRREALDRNLALTYPGGTASPVALPYAALTGNQ